MLRLLVEVPHMVRSVSRKRVLGSEDDMFIGRLTRAQDEGRVRGSFDELFDAMVGRGGCGQVPRLPSLDQQDGGHNKW